MKVTVFTSNQRRHVSLIRTLAGIADEVYAIQECKTVFAGLSKSFTAKTDVMREYFGHVQRAEAEVFEPLGFLPDNVRTLALNMGDVSNLELRALGPALDVDAIVVFGASWIKGPLCEAIVERGALNVHMGLSPYYRGSACNFWALYDRRPDLVGGTIHLLSKGLDSGDILFHALPPRRAVDPFVFGMEAVRAAHTALARHLGAGTLKDLEPVPQDRGLELRFAKRKAFTEEVATEYLANRPTPEEVERIASAADMDQYIRPEVG